jgi:hypothetical protein
MGRRCRSCYGGWRQNDAYITGGVHMQHELHEMLRLFTLCSQGWHVTVGDQFTGPAGISRRSSCLFFLLPRQTSPLDTLRFTCSRSTSTRPPDFSLIMLM